MHALSSLKPLFTLALAGLALVACGGGSPSDSQQQPSGTGVYSVELPYRKAVALPAEALQLTLTGVRDSRCPVQVTCIHAGNAELDLEVVLPGAVPQVKTVQLALYVLPGSSSNAVSLDGYRFALQGLRPDRPAGNEQPSAYVASVRVERLPR